MTDEHPQAAGELPPEPEQRDITPAPEDFENQPPGRKFAWPLFWALLAFVLWAVIDGGGWKLFEGH